MSTSPISSLYEINVALDWICDGMEYNEHYGAAYTLKAVTARLLAIINAMEVDQIENLENIAPSLVLRGMVKQLEALVDPIADLRGACRG